MKTIVKPALKFLCLAGFAAVLLVLFVGNCDAAEPKAPPPVADNMDDAIKLIEQKVIAATVKGDTAAASQWSQTLLAVHASRYVGPIGDLLASFKDAGKKLPDLIAVAVEIDSMTPPDSAYDSYFEQQATLHGFRGDVEKFRRSLACKKLWQAATADMAGEHKYKPNAEQRTALLQLRQWIEAGCQEGHLPANLAELLATSSQFQEALKVFRPQLRVAFAQ